MSLTPSEINTLARQQYNAIGDSFYSDTEIYYVMYKACLELALKANVIERVYTASTVSGTQEYAFPTNVFAIKRITSDGLRLSKIDFRQDDLLTVYNQSTTATGDPQYYAIFNKTFYLRPVPGSVKTLKVFGYAVPQVISATSTLEIPDEYQMALVDPILQHMSAKNKNYEGAAYYANRWQETVKDCIEYSRRRNAGDSFATVTDVDLQPETIIGTI